MRVEIITKEMMFKLVKTYAGSEYEKDNEDYFAMAKSAEDCKFELRNDKVVLRYKNDDEFITATLYRRCYPDYEDEMCCRLSVKVDKEFVEFEVSVDLMELCGMVVE